MSKLMDLFTLPANLKILKSLVDSGKLPSEALVQVDGWTHVWSEKDPTRLEILKRFFRDKLALYKKGLKASTSSRHAVDLILTDASTREWQRDDEMTRRGFWATLGRLKDITFKIFSS